MVKATVRKVAAPAVKTTVTVAPPATPQPAAPVVEAQVVDTPVAGVQVECQNTAAPVEPGLESIILPPSVPDAPLPDHPAPPEACAVATRPAAAIGRPVSASDSDGFDSSDDKYPVLRIVAGSGKLSQMFQGGSLVIGMTLDETELLCPPPDLKTKRGAKITFVPLGLRKAWRENLGEEETAEGIQPRYFQTREEVEAAGGTTTWIDNQPPSFKATSTCPMLIQQPEGSESSLFTTELDGKLWVPAVYYASNSAYKTFAIPLHNVKRTLLQVPTLDAEGKVQKDQRGFIVKHTYFPRFTWTFCIAQTTKKRVNDNREFTVFVPEIRANAKEETGPELRAFAEALIGSAPADAGE